MDEYDDYDDYEEEEGKNEFQILYHKLHKYHSRISRIEKLFLYICLIYIFGYSCLGIAYLIVTGVFITIFPFIMLIFFPIISAIITVSKVTLFVNLLNQNTNFF